MKITALSPAGVAAVVPGYSPAILAEGTRLLYISGQGPNNFDADIETQMRETFAKIGALLQAAGGSWKNVTMLRTYFLNMPRDLATFRKVRLELLAEPYPASTAVGTNALAIPRLEFEIEAFAVL